MWLRSGNMVEIKGDGTGSFTSNTSPVEGLGGGPFFVWLVDYFSNDELYSVGEGMGIVIIVLIGWKEPELQWMDV